ncbi:MAG: 16S rRNA (adenine(1518)-N(6)/adenine(1519)-N(6))-dimethyltransferase RsmA [Actinomycetia bacterium]|nr:16S rRNA (adenine(1518)-N(6)/adenine(1519)-N(6))-dimethyltransferase RsmA [Actinomycetes bacterium]
MDDGSPQGRDEIKQLLADAGHRPNKELGQNFLTDPDIVNRIVSLARVNDRTCVVEIGAGTGTLTMALASASRRVVAYEIDPHLESILSATVGGMSNVEVRIADASRVRLEDELVGEPWTLVANLPYNVGTGIVLDALTGSPKVESFVVMVQREVADRMLAHPGSKTYGLPSVVVGLHAKGTVAFAVSPEVFDPPPRVDSAVILLERVEPDEYAQRALEVAAGAFGQRRKMLRRSLASVLSDPVATIVAAGIDPTLRAEDLAPEEFVAIARAEEAS